MKGIKMTENTLLTVNQFSEQYPSFTRGSLRSLIFSEKTNGFCKVTRRIGGRVLLDTKAFDAWILEQDVLAKKAV